MARSFSTPLYERCAALDVYKKTVVTTIMLTQADGSVQEQTRTGRTPLSGG